MNKQQHPIELQLKRPQLFLDLDGVFADFDEKFHEISGLKPCEFVPIHGTKLFWQTIYAHAEFFAELQLIPGCEQLWAICSPQNPVFLTGLPATYQAPEQKRQWVARQFGQQYQTIVLPKRMKCLYALQNGFKNILIDDDQNNISEWTAMGGHGILHIDNYAHTINQLKQHIT